MKNSVQLNAKKVNSDLSVMLCTKVKSIWIKDLDIRPLTIRYREENIGRILSDIGADDIFKNETPLAIQLEKK